MHRWFKNSNFLLWILKCGRLPQAVLGVVEMFHLSPCCFWLAYFLQSLFSLLPSIIIIFTQFPLPIFSACFFSLPDIVSPLSLSLCVSLAPGLANLQVGHWGHSRFCFIMNNSGGSWKSCQTYFIYFFPFLCCLKQSFFSTLQKDSVYSKSCIWTHFLIIFPYSLCQQGCSSYPFWGHKMTILFKYICFMLLWQTTLTWELRQCLMQLILM